MTLIFERIVRWLAYWAIGHFMSSMLYRQFIIDTLDEMYSLIPFILPQNRTYAREYLSEIWETVMTLTLSMRGRESYPRILYEKFGACINEVEMRFRMNLELINYRVDSVDTFYIIAGPTRLEKVCTCFISFKFDIRCAYKNLFPVLRLLLRRHLHILQLACHLSIDRKELYDATDSVRAVMRAVRFRLIDLRSK